MCACESDFTCPRCSDTPRDDRYEENAPPPVDLLEPLFDDA